MSIFGVSGAQGAGKTEILKALTLKGWKVDQFKVSRAVQAQLGWESLDRVMDAPETMIKFQEEVFRQKFKNDSALPRSDETIFTERTFADIYAYTSHWADKFVADGRMTNNERSTFICNYKAQCRYAQDKIYGGKIILVPMMDHIPTDNDPNRAKREEAHLIYDKILDFVDNSFTYPLYEKLEINVKTIEDRVTMVENFVRRLNDTKYF